MYFGGRLRRAIRLTRQGAPALASFCGVEELRWTHQAAPRHQRDRAQVRGSAHPLKAPLPTSGQVFSVSACRCQIHPGRLAAREFAPAAVSKRLRTR